MIRMEEGKGHLVSTVHSMQDRHLAMEGELKLQCCCKFSSNLAPWMANTGNPFCLPASHWRQHFAYPHLRPCGFWFILLRMPPLLFSQNVNICSVCILIVSLGVLLTMWAVVIRRPQDPLLCARISCLMTLAWHSWQPPCSYAPD